LAESFIQRFFILKELPGKFLQSLEGVTGFNKDAFIKVHESGEQVTSIRLNPAKTVYADHSPFTTHHSPPTNAAPVPWSQYGFYLQQRPSFTFDPLFHAGAYYVQEASSMFLEQAFRQLVDLSNPFRVLDLCAAPGGKSTHIQSLISPGSLLVSNEIIRGRNNILVDNITKWGCNNVVVSNNDPAAFQKLPGFFDVMVVDAPCSGSGLFRKDEEAIDEWSLNNVQLCSQRQQRILADALSTLKGDGILIYCTCSYSQEEDEEIMDWLVDEFHMQTLPLDLASDWNIIESTSSKTNAKGYRFYPNVLKGEGFFLACFRKTSSERQAKHRPSKLDKAPKKETALIEQWLKTEDGELFKENDSFFVLPSALINEYAILRYALNIRYKGVGLGQIMKDRLVPAHSLALSTLISDHITSIDLSYGEAIKYLQRQDVNLNTTSKGWQLVTFKGHKLGWINVLPNRVNNYYPKEWRILKQQNDSAFEK
jgi:16S rRNA C967 or C1407 C5-methylase (RsmB/RsmF family)/NOL1/NOP2/fmu family ribosome biogenesis protein